MKVSIEVKIKFCEKHPGFFLHSLFIFDDGFFPNERIFIGMGLNFCSVYKNILIPDLNWLKSPSTIPDSLLRKREMVLWSVTFCHWSNHMKLMSLLQASSIFGLVLVSATPRSGSVPLTIQRVF